MSMSGILFADILGVEGEIGVPVVLVVWTVVAEVVVVSVEAVERLD